MARLVAIVNPQAAGGRAALVWPSFRTALSAKGIEVETRETERPEHAELLTREALDAGAVGVIAVGGDGTANEVVNGFFRGRESIRPEARFIYVPAGTGGDLQRTLQLPDNPEPFAEMVAGGKTDPIDVGLVRLTAPDGSTRERLFVNLTSFGMGGDVSVVAKRTPIARLSGKAAFLYATLRVFLSYRGKRVKLWLDDRETPVELDVTNVAIGNGRFHGGGMHPCPRADMRDGLLETTTIERLSMFELIRDLRILYSDDVYVHRKVRHYRVKRLRAESDERTLAEVDGEALGGLPLVAEILPSALNLAVP